VSPLGIILVRILRTGLLAASALVAVFIGIEVWKNWGGQQDFAFIGILAAMLIGGLLLARSAARELRNNRMPEK
jgi:hypothetical protein